MLCKSDGSGTLLWGPPDFAVKFGVVSLKKGNSFLICIKYIGNHYLKFKENFMDIPLRWISFSASQSRWVSLYSSILFTYIRKCESYSLKIRIHCQAQRWASADILQSFCVNLTRPA